MSDTKGNIEEGGNDRSPYMEIKVVGPDSNESHFRVRATTEMAKLKKSYSERVGLHLKSLRFLYNGKRVRDDSTPKQLKMEENDVIEVYQEQTGGNGRVIV